MRIDVAPNFEQEIERQVEFRAGKERVAAEVVKFALTFSPERTGDYKRGLKVKHVGPNVYVAGTDWKSHWIEWGSVNNKASHPILRGSRAAGLKVDELKRGARTTMRTMARGFDLGVVEP